MKKLVLALGLCLNSVFAIDLGVLLLSPEAGATFSYMQVKSGEKEGALSNQDKFSPGAYARLWVGIFGLMIAPQVKYDYLKSSYSPNGESGPEKLSIHNIQYGGVLGFRIPLIKLTPFVGASYSTFKGSITADTKLESTYAINFGARWEVPLIPLLTLGFEGSWQKPKLVGAEGNVSGGSNIEFLNLGATIGLAF